MPTEGIISAGDLLALAGLAVAILIAMWRMTESVRKDLRAELLESRRESAREHRELEQKIDARFEKIDARFEKFEARLEKFALRFDALEGRIRRSVTALLE